MLFRSPLGGYMALGTASSDASNPSTIVPSPNAASRFTSASFFLAAATIDRRSRWKVLSLLQSGDLPTKSRNMGVALGDSL